MNILMYTEEQCASIMHTLITELQKRVYATGFTKVVLGLSGGIDSAFVLALAVRALGKDAVSALFLPSQYTSEESSLIAHDVASAVGCAFYNTPITPILESCQESFSLLTGSGLCGIAKENIQARIRGTMLMAYANTYNAILLATSNKSELAVGFCTLYGDTCGAIAPIGDIYKTHVYTLARYYNTTYGVVFPERLFERPPSAELAHNQKDTDRLPEYPTLDAILYGLEHNAMENMVTIDEECVRNVKSLQQKALFKHMQYPPVIPVIL